MKFLCFVLLSLPVSTAISQEINWKTHFSIKQSNIAMVDIDNANKLFLTDKEGNITVYNYQGDSVYHYSPTYQGKLDQLETSRTVNIFTFSRDLQRIEILDRFLTPLFSTRLASPDFGNISAASLGNNLKVWLFDETNYNLLQWDYQRNTLLQSLSLNMIIRGEHWTVKEIVEYKNLVFINVSNQGIYLLDNQGNYIGFLPISPDQKMVLYENYLLSMEKGQLVITNYLTGKSLNIAAPLPAANVAIGKKVIIFFTAHTLKAYQIPDKLFPGE